MLIILFISNSFGSTLQTVIFTSDSTPHDIPYSDWVKKSDLDALESAELKPRLPSTTWEKARLPIIVGAGALLAGSLMLALN